jgi:choline dehydrogenase-like flavoprotein
MTLPSGRALGGSTAINSGLYTTPSQACIDSWAWLGNRGWDWKTLEPYFHKSHTLEKPSEADMKHLGIHDLFSASTSTSTATANGRDDSGPVHVSYPSILDSPFPQAWRKTFQSLGYDSQGSSENGTAFGPFPIPATINPATKQRSYAATAYFEPVKDRENLTVLTETTVTKILFEGAAPNLVASGVEFVRKDGPGTEAAKPKKEVILAAGPIQSPRLLELSGIGSPHVLEPLGISVLSANVNVGENLQDSLITGVSFEAADGVETADDLVRGKQEALGKAMGDYVTSQSGPFSRAAVTCSSFLSLPELKTSEGREEIKLLLDANPQTTADPAYHASIRSLIENADDGNGMTIMYAAQANFGASTAKEFVQPVMDENFITVCSVLLSPLSTGSVHISSTNILANPKLDFKYLTNPLDVEVLARHVRFIIEKIVSTEPFASLLKPNGKRNKLFESWKSIDDIKQYVRKTAMSNWHPVGTCAMLPREKGGVVGEDLIVYDTKNLRVVDASMMPVLPRSNTQSVVYAVAERAADLIKSVS